MKRVVFLTPSEGQSKDLFFSYNKKIYVFNVDEINNTAISDVIVGYVQNIKTSITKYVLKIKPEDPSILQNIKVKKVNSGTKTCQIEIKNFKEFEAFFGCSTDYDVYVSQNQSKETNGQSKKTSYKSSKRAKDPYRSFKKFDSILLNKIRDELQSSYPYSVKAKKIIKRINSTLKRRDLNNKKGDEHTSTMISSSPQNQMIPLNTNNHNLESLFEPEYGYIDDSRFKEGEYPLIFKKIEKGWQFYGVPFHSLDSERVSYFKGLISENLMQTELIDIDALSELEQHFILTQSAVEICGGIKEVTDNAQNNVPQLSFNNNSFFYNRSNIYSPGEQPQNIQNEQHEKSIPEDENNIDELRKKHPRILWGLFGIEEDTNQEMETDSKPKRKEHP